METRVTKRVWKGVELIDIRKYFIKDGEFLPSKKGISLTPVQFNALMTEFGAERVEVHNNINERLPFSLNEKILIDAKVQMEFRNGENIAHVDPLVINATLGEISQDLLTGILELCSEHEIEPDQAVNKIFRYL